MLGGHISTLDSLGGGSPSVGSMYSRQQNPYNVLYFWKDMSIVHDTNILNP